MHAQNLSGNVFHCLVPLGSAQRVSMRLGIDVIRTACTVAVWHCRAAALSLEGHASNTMWPGLSTESNFIQTEIIHKHSI